MSCCSEPAAAGCIARVFRVLAMSAALLASTAALAPARIIRVPEDAPTIDLAVSEGQDGDTLSLAPGTYPPTRFAISKALVLRGRGATSDATLLQGLTVGRARIENVMFRLPQGPVSSLILVEATDSLSLADCVFRGGAIGLRAAAPALAAKSYIRLERCRFEGVLLGVQIIANSAAGPRVELLGCTLSGPANGIELSRPPESCAGTGSPPPPEIIDSEALLRISSCAFEDVEETAIAVSMVDNGLVADVSTFVRCRTPIALRLAGATLTGCTLTGSGQQGRGIDGLGARINLRNCRVSGFEYGLFGIPFGTCRDSGGRIGPTLQDRNRLAGNSIALAGGAAFQADYNSWGPLTCEGVNAVLEPTDTGSPRVGTLLDDADAPAANCSTAVEATTWGGLKARFAGPEARH